MTLHTAKPPVFIALLLLCGMFLNRCGSSGKGTGEGNGTPPTATSAPGPAEWDGTRDYPSTEFTFKDLER